MLFNSPTLCFNVACATGGAVLVEVMPTGHRKLRAPPSRTTSGFQASIAESPVSPCSLRCARLYTCDRRADSPRTRFPFATPHFASEAEPQGALRLRHAHYLSYTLNTRIELDRPARSHAHVNCCIDWCFKRSIFSLLETAYLPKNLCPICAQKAKTPPIYGA